MVSITLHKFDRFIAEFRTISFLNIAAVRLKTHLKMKVAWDTADNSG